MGKPLFRLIPVWIAVLGRLLKTAKASRRLLPSPSSNYYEILVSKLCKQVQDTPAILLKALHCGAPLGQTDSFRFLPPTSSSSARAGSHRSSNSRSSAAKLLLSNCMAHGQHTDSFRVFYHHQGLQSPRGSSSSSRMCMASPAGHRILEEEEDELSSQQYTTASSTLDDGSSPTHHILHANDHQMHHDRDVDSIAYDADNDADESDCDDDVESVQPCQDGMASSSSCCMPMIMQSDDPYSDFLSSIKDMMRVTHHHQLEGLLSAYLALNAPKYHSTITLAFLDALACLSPPSG